MSTAPKPSPPAIAPGVRVRITLGLAVGTIGVVQSKWPKAYGSVEQWLISSNDLVRKRVMRADHLEVVP